MTKQELLDVLTTKFHRVETAQLQQTYGNLGYYLVKVYDKVGDAIRDMNIAFYVEDEGEATEAAYWSPSEPKPDPVSGFQQDVATFIAAKITDGTIEAAFTEMIDQVNETAIFKVVMPNFSEKRLFVDKDAGVLRYNAIV